MINRARRLLPAPPRPPPPVLPLPSGKPPSATPGRRIVRCSASVRDEFIRPSVINRYYLFARREIERSFMRSLVARLNQKRALRFHGRERMHVISRFRAVLIRIPRSIDPSFARDRKRGKERRVAATRRMTLRLTEGLAVSAPSLNPLCVSR